MENTQVEFVLSKPLEYADRGQQAKTSKLILIAPSFDNRNVCIKLRQYYSRANADWMRKNYSLAQNYFEKTQQKPLENEPAKKTEKEKFNFDNVFSSDVDAQDFMAEFEVLLTAGVCKMSANSEITLTTLLLKSLSLKDFQALCEVYFESFLQ